MNDTQFDAWARRADGLLDRRAVFGMPLSVVLALVSGPSIAGKKDDHASGGSGGKKGSKGHGGKKKKKRQTRMTREECEENYGACVDYWAVGYCNGYTATDLRANCQLSFIACCADLLTCTKEGNARHSDCVTLMDVIW